MAQPPRIAASMKREALLSSAFFRPMRPEEIDEILGFAVERRYPRGATVMAKGDPGSSMLAVLAGRLRVSSVSADGREITLNVIGPGEIVGEFALLDGKPRSNDVIAVEDTTVMVIERKEFMPFLLRHETLVERLLVVLCDKLRRTSLALEEIALFDVPGRLARLLVKLAADYGRPVPKSEGDGVRIDLKLSQRDLSTLVASTRESVNKQLRVWREEGAIDQRDGYLIVRKPEALQTLVE
jgi:CRP-like cAMP-binding protein